jgi:hypothetical protein
MAGTGSNTFGSGWFHQHARRGDSAGQPAVIQLNIHLNKIILSLLDLFFNRQYYL